LNFSLKMEAVSFSETSFITIDITLCSRKLKIVLIVFLFSFYSHFSFSFLSFFCRSLFMLLPFSCEIRLSVIFLILISLRLSCYCLLDDTNIQLHSLVFCRLQSEQTSGHIWNHQAVMDLIKGK